ncbi:DUF2913 family protein [Vibrio sp. Isolate25]|uniref:DUF2913 family protein n=1 Tax=Vibrio sp. Isolate25 TaxID=2908535 RepID=UPI001EFEBE15|nr:DUF2913 family protein [Vibrio sp. Isolate25]
MVLVILYQLKVLTYLSVVMQIRKDFDYYRCLHSTVTHALLYLLIHVSSSQRHLPTSKRNELLIKYLKPKLKERQHTIIKKGIKLMINVARQKGGNLERKLYELNDKAKQTKVAGAEKLYSLLVFLYEREGLESRLFDEQQQVEKGVLYMLEEHIELGFDADNNQIAPLSLLIESTLYGDPRITLSSYSRLIESASFTNLKA